MKRPEERQTPGRKAIYENPVRYTIVLPEAILTALEASDTPGTSRNQKLVNALSSYLQERGFPAA